MDEDIESNKIRQNIKVATHNLSILELEQKEIINNKRNIEENMRVAYDAMNLEENIDNFKKLFEKDSNDISKTTHNNLNKTFPSMS